MGGRASGSRKGKDWGQRANFNDLVRDQKVGGGLTGARRDGRVGGRARSQTSFEVDSKSAQVVVRGIPSLLSVSSMEICDPLI